MTAAVGIAESIRRTVIEQSKRANVGHIGSSLSIVDICRGPLRGSAGRAWTRTIPTGTASSSPRATRRWRSTGRCTLPAGCRASSLTLLATTDTGSAAHPEHACRGSTSRPARWATASRLATGAALAARLQGSSRRVFALLSDAESTRGRFGRRRCSRPPSAGESGGDCRCQRPAGVRLHPRRARPRAAVRPLAQLRLGRPRGRRPRPGCDR